jgi:hypothetical protein
MDGSGLGGQYYILKAFIKENQELFFHRCRKGVGTDSSCLLQLGGIERSAVGTYPYDRLFLLCRSDNLPEAGPGHIPRVDPDGRRSRFQGRQGEGRIKMNVRHEGNG